MPETSWTIEGKERNPKENPKAILAQIIRNAVNNTLVFDIHTHLFPPRFSSLLLWGIDELLTYHYLVAESIRVSPLRPEQFLRQDKKTMADHVFRTLFLDRIPVSEASRGIVTILHKLGISDFKDLAGAREWFRRMDPSEQVSRVLSLAGVRSLSMTNDPLDPIEQKAWEDYRTQDPRFFASLRLDKLVNGYPSAIQTLKTMGYDVDPDLSPNTLDEVKRFLEDWTNRTDAKYFAVSLAPDFSLREDSPGAAILTRCILPISKDTRKPLALMIGVRRGVNPALGAAGDSVGKGDIGLVESLCRDYPDNRFLVTFLSRENQQEACVAARKFPNLMPFGCWWFLNTPSMVREITALRMELLGSSFLFQHSDARVLEQLIYKWTHSREILSEVLTEHYGRLLDVGWNLREEEIQRDVERLLGGNFNEFIRR